MASGGSAPLRWVFATALRSEHRAEHGHRVVAQALAEPEVHARVARFCGWLSAICLVGMMLLADGDRAGAKPHFQASVATRCFYLGGYDLSRTFLARMEADPAWPKPEW